MNPEIIGGLVVEIGDKYLVRARKRSACTLIDQLRSRCVLTLSAPQDLSLDTRIRKMEQLLQQPL